MRKCEVLDKQNFEPKYGMVYDIICLKFDEFSKELAMIWNMISVTDKEKTKTKSFDR